MDTREKIIRAALSQFQTHGFIAATTKSIAAEAGVAEVTLFRYFGDKKTLFRSVADHIAERFGLPDIPRIQTGNFRQDATLVCQGLLRHFIQYNALFRMLMFEAKHNEDIRLVLQDVRVGALRNMWALASHYADSGGCDDMALVEWLSNSLMGASLSYCMFHNAEDRNTYVGTHAALIANAFVDAMETIRK